MPLDLFPLKTVLFPRMRLPLHIFEPRYRAMIRDCLEHDARFGIVLIEQGEEVGGPATPYSVGTTARVTNVELRDDGSLDIVAAGERRFRIESIVQTEPHLKAEVSLSALAVRDPSAVATLGPEVRAAFRRALELMLALKSGYSADLDLPQDPEGLAFLVGAGLLIDDPTRQQLLEAESLDALLDRERDLIAQHIDELERRLTERLQSRRN